jgi:hypothetical protein
MLNKKKNRDSNNNSLSNNIPISIPKVSLTQISVDYSLINQIPEINKKLYLRSNPLKIKDHRDKKEKEKKKISKKKIFQKKKKMK